LVVKDVRFRKLEGELDVKYMPRIFAFLAFAVLALAGCDELGQSGRFGDYGSL
jgi:hypothetical protein